MFWFFVGFENGKWQCLHALREAIRDTEAPISVRQLAEAVLYLYSVLMHLLEPTIVSPYISEGTGWLLTFTIVELLSSHQDTRGMKGRTDFLNCLTCVLHLLSGPAHLVGDATI